MYEKGRAKRIEKRLASLLAQTIFYLVGERSDRKMRSILRALPFSKACQAAGKQTAGLPARMLFMLVGERSERKMRSIL